MRPALQALVSAAGSFLVVSLLLALIFLLCRRPKSPHSHPRRRSSAPILPLSHTPSRPEESASFDPSVKISMAVLVKATRNFSPDLVVGDGSFGFVYKASLPPDGTPVAVKRLSADAFHGFREFAAEIETLGRIRHPNLARILGYCSSGKDRVLVYEFLERGSLDQWMHEADDHRAPLPWPVRVRIVKGVAAGLAFLHDGCCPSIIHRDIKASNVLLDAAFEARIADFGLARTVDSSRSHVSTQVAGTMGYMPPEYKEGAPATVKADVYSFGVLMLEVATGKRPNPPVPAAEAEAEWGRREVWLIRWTRKMVDEGREVEMVDPAAKGEGVAVAEGEVMKYMEVAMRCTAEGPRERPTMREVVAMVDQL